MDKKILVAYATYYGTTREVAETIAKTITEHGYEVEVISAREARDVSRYGAVIVGSAIRGG
ncbi:MAG TPA: flavodoxin, partial [Anaerolineaceae bacterium]|nr:flavodoxin [Anaerolineaceae bacterium]